MDIKDYSQMMSYLTRPRDVVPESRNMYDGGGAAKQLLVQPSDDGSRPGYAKSKKKINRDESYRTVVKDFTATSGPGTGKIFDDPAAIEIVKANLNRIKKQKNNKAFFEWSEDSDWYKKLRKELNPNTKTGTNREFTNKLINQVVDEFFPGAYHGKNAIKNFRNDTVVKSFVQHLKSVGEFDGQEKFDKVLDQFTYKKNGKRKNADHLYEDINRSWKSWINGDFEVNGIDRTGLKKELKARGIDYSQIDNWSASSAQGRGTAKIKEIKWLDNQNTKFVNRNAEQVKALFKKQFPNGNFELRVNELTQLKRNGVYVSGATTEKGITGIVEGDRAGWLKTAYGKQFAGNYSKIINAADQLAAAGEISKAERLYKAADQFFGPNGIIRKSAVGEAEHALARSFDFLNPERQLAINSIVSGDLNQFKKNLFDIPVKQYFEEYNNPNTTTVRRKELKNLIEERKKIMNSLTGGQKNGIVAGDIVNFRYGPNQITVSSSVEALDTKFKKGEFDIQEYISRGNSYDEAFKTVGSQANIFTQTGDVKSIYSKPINEKKANILSAFCNSKRKGLKLAGSVDGLTCSMEEIQTNMQKQIDQAAKVSKDGKIPKRFGKLTGFAKTFFGDVAIPLEYMFAAPYLAAGDIEGAKRATTAGLFGYGKVDLEKLPPGEGKKYIRHTNSLTNFLKNYQSKLMAENSLQNLEVGDEGQAIYADQLARAEKNMAKIVKDYKSFGYTFAPGEKGLLEGKVAAQQLIRDQVQSDYDKKIDKAASTEFFKDSDPELLRQNLEFVDKYSPNEITPITDLESYIKNKGEATAGNTNLFFDVKPYTLNRAEAYGVPDIFDTYAGGYAGVETSGSPGIKDVRDAYSSLPINMASQLADLEKKEFEEGMLKRKLKQELFAEGGITRLRSKYEYKK